MTITIPRPGNGLDLGRLITDPTLGPLSGCTGECLWGTQYRDPADGQCKCPSDASANPTKLPPQAPYGYGYFHGGGRGRWGSTPAPLPAPVITKTPEPAATPADDGLWLGLEPWKLLVGGGLLAGGIYLATQGAPK